GLQVPAKRGDFMRPVVPVQHGDRAVLDPHGDGALEELAYLLGRRRGRQVEVVVLESEQVVPDRAADAPGFVAALLELLRDFKNLVGDREAVWKLHSVQSVECGMRNAELQGKVARVTTLTLTLRIPHSAFRIGIIRTTHSPH